MMRSESQDGRQLRTVVSVEGYSRSISVLGNPIGKFRREGEGLHLHPRQQMNEGADEGGVIKQDIRSHGKGPIEPRHQSVGQTAPDRPHEVWGVAGRAVDKDSAAWRASIDQEGLAKKASRQTWGETTTQMRHWLILNPTDLSGIKWDFIYDVLRKAERRQLALKLWLSEPAKDPMAVDLLRRELAGAQLNPQSASGIAGLIAWGSVDSTMMGRASKEASRAVRVRKRRRRYRRPKKGNGLRSGASRIGRGHPTFRSPELQDKRPAQPRTEL